LSFLFVVTPGSDTRDDGDSEKNGCSVNPSVADGFRSGERGIDHNGEDSAHDKNLEHEVIEGSEQKIAELSSLRSLLVVASEGHLSAFDGQSGGSEFDTSLESISESLGTVELVLHVGDVFDVLPLPVAIDHLLERVLGDLILQIVGGSFGVVHACHFNCVGVSGHVVYLSY